MAGLSRNFLLKQKSFPDDPLPSYDDLVLKFYGASTSNTGGNSYLPGFANDDGDFYSIKFTNAANVLTYFQSDGTQITSGNWNGGFYASEVNDGGGNAGNYFVGLFMDTTDNLLYGVALNSTPATDQMGLFHINKSGSWTLVGGSWRDLSDNANSGYNSTWIASLKRTGGDGSGNFELISAYSPSNGYRMMKYTFNVSTGALTETAVLPAGFGNNLTYFNGPLLGPTTNNIMLHVSGQYEGLSYGMLQNTSTGKRTNRYIFFNSNRSGGGMSSFFFGNTVPRAYYWRGHVFVQNGSYGLGAYSETDLFNYIDQMADYYGLL